MTRPFTQCLFTDCPPSSVVNTSLIKLLGSDGDDRLTLDETHGTLPKASLVGGNGNDTLTGGSGADTLNGDGGNDLLVGKAGNDQLFGGTGNDTLTGGGGKDQLRGQAGNGALYSRDDSASFCDYRRFCGEVDSALSSLSSQ